MKKPKKIIGSSIFAQVLNESDSSILKESIAKYNKKYQILEGLIPPLCLLMWFIVFITLFKVGNTEAKLIYFIWTLVGFMICANVNIVKESNITAHILLIPIMIWVYLFSGIISIIKKIYYDKNYPTLAKIRQNKIKKASKF